MVELELKIIKQIYSNWETNFRVLSCVPADSIPTGLELNKWGNFTLSGSNLRQFDVGQKYNLKIRPDQRSKYPASYIVAGFQGVDIDTSGITVTVEAQKSILQHMMTDGQAQYVTDAYPDFVQRVLRGEESTIDYNNIYNVGKVRVEEYIDKVKADCRSLLFYPICDSWSITNPNEIEKLTKIYELPDQLQTDLDTNPYRILIGQLDHTFTKADKIILSHHPEMAESTERCEYACIEILKQNELEGDTRINANLMAKLVKDLAPECVNHIVDAVTNSQMIHYEPERKYTALANTYEAELNIAQNIKSRLEKCDEASNLISKKWQDYCDIDGFTLTDEQSKILQLATDERVALLTGGGGCVDCDTEFFNGYEWKRIADYQPNDKVLQYNDDGTAELVEPTAYIKLPCDTLWHFETKYGINQTVCDEHRIVYWSPKGIKHECTIQDIVDKQSNNGWTGQFATTFKYNGKGIDLSDEQIRVMCAVICDGSFQAKSNTNWCRFHIKKDRKKERLRLLFADAGIKWKEVKSSTKGYIDFYIIAPIRTKEFNSYWYNCSNHQLQVICDEVMFWDGNENYTKNGAKRMQFSTTVKITADFIQFAYSSCGYRASIRTNDRSGQEYFTCGKIYTRKSVEYSVIITNRSMIGICCDNRTICKKTIPVQVLTTDGYKYCFKVPSTYLVLRRKNCIFVTGNCGKTASMKALILMLEDMGYTYTLLAPTGVAAKRLRESTGRPASTIHMALIKNNDWGNYIIIDETSMVAVHLLSNLLTVVPKTSNLIFIADEAQLASISCGNIVQDFIDSGIIPRANLTKVFRYGVGGIATVATDVRFGKGDSLTSDYDDYTFVPSTNNVISQIVDEYEKLIEKGYSVNDIIALCPYNKTKVGTYAINNALQSRFNPHVNTGISYKRDSATISFKLGDKVINTKNNYRMPVLDYDDDMNLVDTGAMTFIANGDIGTIRAYNNNDDGTWLIVEFDNTIVRIEGTNIKELLLGYAISVHKSQGSQAPAVICVIDKMHKQMMSRNLTYVGVSRAQKELVMIGDEDTIVDGLSVQENKERDTYLKEMLADGTV